MNKKEQDLIDLMMQLESVLRREMIRHYHNHTASFNPHNGQGRVISLLKMQPEMSQKNLAYLLNMSKQALAELLRKLEDTGYITRTPSIEDRRVMIIRLTDSGLKAADDIENKQEDTSSVFSCLTEEEQDNLYNYMKKLIESCEDNMSDKMRRHHRNRHMRFEGDE